MPDPKRSILGGCFVREAFKYNPDTWDGRMMFSLSTALGFSLDTPWKELPEAARHAILYGIEPARSRCLAARREGQARRAGRPGGRLRRHRAAHRALLPPLPPARRSELADGGVARQGDGRAHVPRLQGRARCARRGCCSPIGGKTIYDVGQLQLRRAARVSRHASSRPAAAPTPAGRC